MTTPSMTPAGRLPQYPSESYPATESPETLSSATFLERLPRWDSATRTLEHYGIYFALAGAFLLPIKLTLGYFAVFPLILLWLTGGNLAIVKNPLVSRILLLAIIAECSGLFGIMPERSMIGALRFGFSLCAIPAVASVVTNPLLMVLAAASGQAVAATATVLELGMGVTLPRYFVGPVTESGQIAFILPLIVGMLFAFKRIPRKVWVGLLAIALLLAAALLLNAKRGPFMGCIVGLAAIFLIRSPRALIPLVAASILGAIAFPELHQRLLHSAEHFTIAGGRREMWNIGAELLSRFPLGIGFDNSAYLRKFSLEVPPEHAHFHNNLINIAVETGWLGLFVFVWWLGAVVNYCWKLIKPPAIQLSQQIGGMLKAPYALGMLGAVISWQVAGLVEYNIGDSEVFVIILVQLGALLSLVIRTKNASDRRTIQTS